MKKLFQIILTVCLCGVLAETARAESKPLRFIWLSDTHVGSPTGEKDLRESVRDINTLKGYSFVIISGDITEFGGHAQFLLAKSILDGLHIPCHVIPGNHDCKWSESGATEFPKVWGTDRFVFDSGGYCFIGMHEGPIMKMGDGHWSPQDVRWLKATLAQLPAGQPLIFVTHYPLDDQLDNWYVVLDLLKKYNIQGILVGHGHRNVKENFEGVPGIMCRSNLRAGGKYPGYGLVEIKDGVLTISERNPGRGTRKPWDQITLEKHDWAAMTNHWPRPDFSVNLKYPDVSEQWQFNSKWTMASSPAVADGRVFAGDASGQMRALSLKTGEPDWSFNTAGAIYSTPAVDGKKLVFASADGNIYAIKTTSGHELWRFHTDRPDVASPCIVSNIVYIGASDGKFRALNLTDGKLKWECPGIGGFVETRPLVTHGKVIFGAWDDYLYELDAANGRVLWKWRGKREGHLGVMYSPAAFWPVEAHGKIFVVAPDRYMTALDLVTGEQLWRTNHWQVRESIGLSPDASRFYVRTMDNTSIFAFSTKADHPEQLWDYNTGVKYDINSAMLVEKNGVLYYGTKNGLLLAMDPRSGTLLWAHKLGVTVLNTVVPLSEPNEVIVSDIDGKVTRIGPRLE